VLTVDPSYVSATFGVARTRLQAGDPAGAIAALARVPETSSYYLAARQTPDLRRRIELVDLANQVRPGTWS
jgi:serine/threonine-protein kinase PknG